jgi:oligopeptide/dipeptide ABC transporter ATP-binding protein
LISGARGNAANKKQLKEKAEKAIEEVGLQAADLDKRPAEFSGGQRQRISIARGLLPQPELLICDEVVSALDVSVQAQILNLLLDIRQKRMRENKTMSFLFIAHDLKVACYFCDRIGVMYAGELLEEAPAENIWRERRHPYTRMLFSAAAGIKGKAEDEGQTAIPKSASPFCAFAVRCPRAAERCYVEAPLMRKIAPNHKLRCHYPG